MESRALKVGWIAMLIMGIYMVFLGLFGVTGTEDWLSNDFTLSTGENWSNFVAANSKAADFLITMGRSMQGFFVAIGILAIFVVWNSYRKAEKWSWYALLVAGAIAWGSGLAGQAATGTWYGLVIMVIGIVLLIIGLAVPAKAILGGERGKK
jgi:hypothetical protein